MKLLTCALGGNGTSLEHPITAQENIASCQNKFKNEAQALGSKLVLLKSENKRIATDFSTDGFGNQDRVCGNCVEMQGIVLIPRSAR